MANQPRPWFRLRSTIGQPPPPAPRPEALTAPLRAAVPLARQGVGRALPFRPIVPAPRPPPPGKTEPSPLPTPTPQASPSSSSSSTSSSSSSSPSPSPPRAPSPKATSPPTPPAAQRPKAAASPPRPVATPPPPTTSVTSLGPQEPTTSPPSPHGRFPTTTSHTVPTAPEQRAPPSLQPVLQPHIAVVPQPAVTPQPQYAGGSPNHGTTSTPTPSPPRGSPMTMKMKPVAAVPPPSPPPPTSIKTPSPTHSTTSKAHVPPPSPLSLPPPQLQPASDYKIPDLPQQKTVLEDSSRTMGNNNYSPQSRAAWHYKPSNGTDDKAWKPTGVLSAQKKATDQVKPKDQFGNKKAEMKGKGKEERVLSSTDSEDSGISIITIAGENKGAVMEVGKYSSPTTWTSGSDVQKNGKGRGLTLKKRDHNGAGDDHGLEGTSKKNGNKNRDKGGGAEKATMAFVNSNVQGVNNSIVYDCALSHDDPGVHLVLTRMVVGHGRRGHGFYFKRHHHIGHEHDN